MKKYEFMSNRELYREFDSSDKGLSSEEASKRILLYGMNLLPKDKKKGIVGVFFSQFKNAITIILVITCLFSFSIGEIVDGVAIIFIILLDVIMGTVQEIKAQKSAEALTNMIKVRTRVLRDKKEIVVDSESITVGDIIFLESGDKISADARIISCSNLAVNESALTGESNASGKVSGIISDSVDNSNMVYAGTVVITGRAKCIVVRIGANTEIGKIATKVIETKEVDSPLTIKMNKFTKQIGVLTIIIAVIITILLAIKGVNTKDMFLSVVALSVSAMPEGLPLALTLALTIGANRMSKRNVIVKKLNSVESLGSCTVIASDKTGTLTVNEQTAKKMVFPDGSISDITGVGYNDDGKITSDNDFLVNEICKCGALNNDAGLNYDGEKWISYGDSIDIAFLALGRKGKIDLSLYEKLGGIPYESENKYSMKFYKDDGKYFCTVKGSYEIVTSFCDKMYVNGKLKKVDRDLIIKQNEELAREGYRVIAIANNCVDDFCEKDNFTIDDIPKLNLLGLVAFIDPVRKEVKKSIDNCLKSDIKVVMITGDHPLTAYSIAKKLDIASDYGYVATGEDIEKNLLLGVKEFDKFVSSKTVFSRVTPIQKLEIVESYKRQGEYVAVTGDGVNDAPALRSANIGVAMGSGTDVAKETSNMIIVDDNFMSIVAGIEEGKNAYANIRKVIYMLLSCGLAEVLFFVLSIMFNLPMPLVAIQLLWLNLVTDGLQDLSLSFEKEDNLSGKNSDKLFDKLMVSEILISGISIGLIVFGVFAFLIKGLNMPVVIARGYVMALMVFIQNIHALNCRSESISVFRNPLRNNILIIFSIFGSILLQIIVMEVDLFSVFLQTTTIPFGHLCILFLFSLPILFIMELFKEIRR